MHSLSECYARTLDEMDSALSTFLSSIPPPQRVPVGKEFVLRFKEKTVGQAITQKLARIISGLQAASILAEFGFLQEQAAIHRMLDEFCEDVLFLSLAALKNPRPPLLNEYLEYFYMEEIVNPSEPLSSPQKRPSVPRRKIRAFITHYEGLDPDPSSMVSMITFIDKAYSGYLHGASPQIMEMVEEFPLRFLSRGMIESPLLKNHQLDLFNYYFRGLLSFAFAAATFENDAISKQLGKTLKNYSQSISE